MEAHKDTLELHGVEVHHHFVGDHLYVKETRIPAGVSLTQHSHPHPHHSELGSGRVEVFIGDRGTIHEAPAYFHIEANVVHRVVALTDAVWFCTHLTDDRDPETVDTSILAGDAHA